MYQESLRAAMAKLGTFCAGPAAPAPCDPTINEEVAALSAFWAAGFWSPSSLMDSSEWIAGSGVAATVLGFPVRQVLLVFAGRDDRVLRLVFDDNPLDTVYPPPDILLVNGATASTMSDPAIAANAADNFVYVAYQDSTGTLRVARSGLLAPFAIDTRFPPVAIQGSPAVAASTSGDLFVAFRDGAGQMRYMLAPLGSTAPATSQAVTGARPDEHEPFLVNTNAGLLLLTASGPRSVCDVVATADCHLAHEQLMRRWMGTAFAVPHVLRRLPMPYGRGGLPPGVSTEPMGMPVESGVDGVGPAAVPFGGARLHLFVPHQGGELTRSIISHFSFIPDTSGTTWSTFSSRVLGMGNGSTSRVAPVVFPSPSGREYLLVYWADAGGRIRRTYRLSF